jgi:hypothetical protein
VLVGSAVYAVIVGFNVGLSNAPVVGLTDGATVGDAVYAGKDGLSVGLSSCPVVGW